MFDGVYQPERPTRYVQRGGRLVKIISTGHPPIAEQLRGQVRSGSGMTFGTRTADGAKMPPAFTSHDLPAAAAPVRSPSLLTDELINKFLEIEHARGSLPTRKDLRAEYGRNILTQLRFMQRTGRIDLWLGTDGNPGIVIRIAGSDLLLRTPGAPETVVFES